MKVGRQQGLAFLLVAALFVGIELAILSEGITFPFMLVGIPVFFLMGIGFLLYPGTAEGKEARKNPALFWAGGSKRDKTVWISTLAVGIIIGMVLLFMFVDTDRL